MVDPAMQLMDLATGYWRAGAIHAAVSLGLFEALAEAEAPAPADADALAARLEVDGRCLAALCDALAGLDLLDKRGDRYAIAEAYRPLLDPAGDRCMIDALRFNIDLYPLWSKLPEMVRQGGPIVPPRAHLGEDLDRTRRFVMGMHSRALALGPTILADVIERGDLADCRSLLDVGCGPGTFGRALAKRHPRLRLTLFDLPPVVATARELTEATDLDERVDHVAGDYRRDPLPGGVDAALYCGALHQESPQTAQTLFRRMRDALNPGGRLFVVDMMTHADGTAPAFSALFSITMMLTSPQARVFTVDQAVALLEAAGFDGVHASGRPDSPYFTIAARRPDRHPAEPRD